MSDTKICHPLRHHGATRLSRLVQALSPDFFRLDERSIQDLITATYRYAQTLRYFNRENQQNGYWDCFWEVETLTFLAVVAAKDTKELRRQYDDAVRAVREMQKASPTGPSPASYLLAVEQLFALALSLEQTYQQLKRINHPLQTLLLNRIKRDNGCDVEELEGALRQLIALHKAADPTLPQHWDRYGPFFATLQNPNGHWGVDNRVAFDSIKVNAQINEKALRRLFLIFYDAWVIIKNAAQSGFDTELARMELSEDVEERAVQPHVALYLAFLHLFRHAQNSLNDLGKGHLDYYYEKVLGLRRRSETPDDVWLLFELAQDVNEHLLEQGTLLPAGKDKNGQPLLYETIENWVLRRAQVADLKNTYFDKVSGRVLANPDVKKAYAHKAEKPNEKASYWRAMGDDTHLPDGEVGFALASPQLILREGKRVADVRIALKKAIDLKTVQASYFKIYLSSKEKWIELDQSTAITENSTPDLPKGAFNIFFKDSTTGGVNEMFIRIVLERDDLPVDTFGPEMAVKAGFDTRWPVMKVVTVPQEVGMAPNLSIVAVGVYEELRQAEITEIKINVAVTGIKENLIIQSDQGVFDGTQKVFPFGPVPEEGNRFYVGSTEVFQKALKSLDVNFEWIGLPDDIQEYYKEYTAVGVPPVNPFVQVDFVDKADASVIRQVNTQKPSVASLTELEQGIYELSGSLNDKLGKPIKDVDVTLTYYDVNNAPITVGPEKFSDRYSFQIPRKAYAIARDSTKPITLAFALSGFEDLRYVIPSTKLISNTDKALINNRIDVILFPPQKEFTTASTPNILKGRVMDLYERGVEDVAVGIAGSSIETDVNGNFDFGNATPPATLLFNKALFVPVGNVTLLGFSIVNVFLLPVFKNDKINASKVVGYSVVEPNGLPLENIYVRAYNGSNLLLLTKTKADGMFSLPSATDFLTLSFNGATDDNYQIDDNNKKIIILPLRYQRQLPSRTTVNIEISVQDAISGSNLSNAIILMSGNSVPIANGKINDIPINERLTFKSSTPDYIDKEIDIENRTNVKVMLFPVKQHEKIGSNATDEKIKIILRNIDSTELNKLKINGFTPTASTFEIDHDNGLSFVHPNFVDKSISGLNKKDEIEVILIPKHQKGNASGNKLEGTIVGLTGVPVNGVRIIAENNDLYYEVETSPQGVFSIDLAGVSATGNWKLTAIKGSQVSVLTDVPKGVGIFITLGTVQASRPFRNAVRGTVWKLSNKNSNGREPLFDVMVTNGSETRKTDVSGRYNFLVAGQASLKFEHPLYQPVTVNITDDSDIDVVMFPMAIQRAITGKVMDVFDNPLQNVAIGLKQNTVEYITSRSATDGQYNLLVPGTEDAITSGLSAVFNYPGFQPIAEGKFNLPIVPDAGKLLSFINVRLFYDTVNYLSLLEGNSVRDEIPVNINALNLKRDIRTQHFEKYSPTLKRGFIRLTLAEGNFLHKEYPKVLLWYAVNAGKEGAVVIPATGTVSVPPVPNEPYTPATNSISLDYTSEQVITGAENIVGGDGSSIDQYFQLLPFNGHKGLDIWKMQPEIVLLYPYKPADPAVLGDVYATGNLFIGLSELEPGGTLSLLIQVAGGTETDPEKLPPDLVWSYLSFNNTWIPFNVGQILKDETRCLTRSGMVQFAIPTTVTNVNTMLDPRYYWLRVAALEDVDKGKSVQALPSIANIRAQVVRARFKNEGNELSHLGQPLPAGLIANLLESRTAVKSVEQPLPSFGGRLPENEGMEFYQRISERLRHRHRAVTVWDYEHLLLEKFLDLAATKCIPHTRYKPAGVASQLAPGYVTVAVIPALSRREDAWPEPRFPKGDLDEMRAFLLKRTNLFVAFEKEDDVHLQVVNPLYEKLDVEVEVKFKEGIDEAYYSTVLTEEIRCYISPWLKDSARPPVFGRKLQRSRLLEFIEEREYVEYVGVEKGNLKDTSIQYLGITMYAVDVAGVPVMGEGPIAIIEDICPSTARSIFVAGDIRVRTAIPVGNAAVPKPNDNKRSASVPIEEEASTQESTDTGTEHAKAEKTKPTKPVQKAKPTTKKAK